MDDGSTNVLI